MAKKMVPGQNLQIAGKTKGRKGKGKVKGFINFAKKKKQAPEA